MLPRSMLKNCRKLVPSRSKKQSCCTMNDMQYPETSPKTLNKNGAITQKDYQTGSVFITHLHVVSLLK